MTEPDCTFCGDTGTVPVEDAEEAAQVGAYWKHCEDCAPERPTPPPPFMFDWKAPTIAGGIA